MSSSVNKELIRQLILVALHSARPSGYSAEILRMTLGREGLQLTDEELVLELTYLAGKEIVEKKSSAISRGSVRWHVTSLGVDYLEEEGLV